MPPKPTLGPYELMHEPRGVRLFYTGAPGHVPVKPMLVFHLDEPGKSPAVFVIDRVLYADNTQDMAVDIVGHCTEKVYLNARVRYNPLTDGLSVALTVQNATEDMDLRVRVQLLMIGEAEPRWLVPGFFYRDNRPPGCTRLFPSFSELGHNPRKLISNYWAFRSDRTACPVVFCWSYGAFGFIATTGVFGQSRMVPQGLGISGLSLAVEHGQPTMAVEFPYREVPAKYSFCHEDSTEPEELYIHLPVNEPLEAQIQLGVGLPDMQAHARVLRFLYEADSDDGDPGAGALPAAEAEAMAQYGVLRWHYNSRDGAIFETAVFDAQFGRNNTHVERPHMHCGWLSGALPAYTLLWSGRESGDNEAVMAGIATLNKITSQLAPAGTLFPVWTEEGGWACSFGPEDGCAHSRTVAEAALFILRALHLEAQYATPHVQWFEAVRSTLNYAVGAQRADGAFPSYYELSVGRVISYEGCAGLAWVAAMAAGYGVLHAPHLREVAQRGGEYYARFVREGFLYGSVEDQPSVPTSDDAHWAVIAYVMLYEMDRNPMWLDLARRAADLALTWRMAYNVQFGPETLAGRYQLQTRGGDITSVAAPTLSPGGLLCYRELVRLAQYLGDEHYRQRAEDARAYAIQMICRADGQFNGRVGMSPAQLFHCDWWQPKGTVTAMSHVMAGALVKLTALTRRRLQVESMVVQPHEAKDPDFPVPKPDFYADLAAMGAEVPPPATAMAPRQPGRAAAADGPIPSLRQFAPSALAGLFSGEAQASLGLSTPPPDVTGAGAAAAMAEEGEVDLPPRSSDLLRQRQSGAIQRPESRGRASRGLSSDQVPLPKLGAEPAPFSDPIAPPSGAFRRPGDDEPDGEVEIKYKIF